MKVIGYAPNSDYPFIPTFILTPTGMYDNQGRPADGESIKTTEFEISDDEWIGVSSIGQIEIFKRSDEENWKVKTIIDAVNGIKDPRSNPVDSIRKLHAASNLVGIDLPSFINELESKRLSGESMVDTWKRIKSNKPDG